MRKKAVYHIFIWVSLILCLGLLVKLAPTLYSPDYILADDFGHFWASGKLFIARENPYDLSSMIRMQVEAGAIQTSSVSIGSQTLNPPWTLLLFAPFSLLDYSVARITWLIITIVLIILSVRQFWILLHGSDNKLWLAFLISFIFAPTYSVLSKGQITPWVLLGITGLLLYSEEKFNVWLAGASIVLISIKPQVFYLLWPALGLWVIYQRRWKLFLSGAGILLLTILILVMVNPKIFMQYITAVQEYPYEQWATPTLGSYLRLFWLGVDKFWIQYLPAVIGMGWVIIHFLRHKGRWVWGEQLPLLSIVSIITTPYAWTYDQIIILPAILAATSWLSITVKPFMIIMWGLYIGINLADLLLHIKLDEFWFLWLAPAYTLWYLSILYTYKKRRSS